MTTSPPEFAPAPESQSPEAPLRVLVIGAGAVGAFIGVSLAAVGCPVTFLERAELADVLRQRGLRLQLPGRELTLPTPNVVASLADALAHTSYDVTFLALKSFDTQPFLQAARPFFPDLPPIVCLQNGVENESLLAEALGEARVIPATLTSAIARNQPGEVVVERSRGMGIAAGHPLSVRLVEILNKAGMNARLYLSAPDMKWSKLLTNLLANASAAIVNLTPAQVFAHPGLYRLEVDQLRETLQVMAAQGIRPVDLPKTPVRLLAFAVRSLPMRLAQPLLQRAVSGGRGAKMPSLHIDLHHRRGDSEVEYLNGAVVRFGSRLGVPTPANRLLYETLLRLSRGELPLSTYDHQPDLFLKEYRI